MTGRERAESGRGRVGKVCLVRAWVDGGLGRALSVKIWTISVAVGRFPGSSSNIAEML